MDNFMNSKKNIRVAVIDNYDSFTFNLVHYILETGARVNVFRNDEICVDDLERVNPGAIVISPGPGRPENAGISIDIVNTFSGLTPILGVCLGHQVIAHSFGGRIIQAAEIMHGKTSKIFCDGQYLFKGIKSPFTIMRYHSLAVSEDGLPEELIITAETEEREIMGIRHREHSTFGVQFHPESFITEHGHALIHNFISMSLNPDRGG